MKSLVIVSFEIVITFNKCKSFKEITFFIFVCVSDDTPTYLIPLD